MQDRRLAEMLALGMRQEQRMFLTVMLWPDPFTTLPWRDVAEELRQRRRLADQPTLWEVLVPTPEEVLLH